MEEDWVGSTQWEFWGAVGGAAAGLCCRAGGVYWVGGLGQPGRRALGRGEATLLGAKSK